MYEQYNRLAKENKIDSVFTLMDTIESIYRSVDHYANSYEIGVLYNNRAASWLTLALYSELRDSTEKDSLILLAEKAIRKSKEIYSSWIGVFDSKDPLQIEKSIHSDFMLGLEDYSADEQKKFLKTRIQEIKDAQEEIDRRLSVSYTNLGIVYRYHLQYDSAAICYQKALELWDRNLSAENNLNALLGRPMRKRNFIERMFPPERL
jgi:tetratricopeptide (TPR) repeat protein